MEIQQYVERLETGRPELAREWLAAHHAVMNEMCIRDRYQPFLVSIYTTVVGTIFGLLVTTMGAYVLIQKDMPGHRLMGKLVLATMLFNGGLIPTYMTIKNLGLMNNMLAVIVPCSVGAYNTILMKSFFASIPGELFDSAAIDGCSPFGAFWRIMLPLSKPALASVGLFIACLLYTSS